MLSLRQNPITIALLLLTPCLSFADEVKVAVAANFAYSGAIRTPIPALPGQSFRDKPDTDSAINQPF